MQFMGRIMIGYIGKEIVSIIRSSVLLQVRFINILFF